MEIKVELGKNFRALELALRKAPIETANAISDGLGKALTDSEYHVKVAVGGGQYLKRRSGHLTQAITSYKDSADRFIGYVGIGRARIVKPYAWLLGKKETKTITPKSGRFLAIPIADGLTARGVPRYTGPRDVPKEAGGFFFNKNETLFYGKKTGKGTFDLLFVLKEEVTITASGVLPETMQQQIPSMVKIIKQAVIKTLMKLGIR